MARKLRTFLSVQQQQQKQRARKASASTVCPLTSNPIFPKSNEPVNPLQVISTICTTAGEQAQKSLRNRYFTSAEIFPKANPTEMLESPEVPSVTHLWPLSIGLLEIRPQTEHITKIGSLECLEAKTKHQVKSCPSCFPHFHSGQAAQGRVWVKRWVIKLGTNCSLILLQLKETCW